MKSQFTDMTSSSIFFEVVFVFLVKFSYWSKFHVNIMTGSGVMITFFYMGLTGNGKYPHLCLAQYLEPGAS